MPKTKRRTASHSRPRRTKQIFHSESAIVRAATPPERPWELNNDQVVLLKNYLKIADASDLELKACLEVARRYRLDPFKQGQIWFIKRWDKNASSVNGSKGAYVYTPQTGIYGLLHIAGRDYPDFGSMSEAEYGPMFTHDVEGHKFKAPEWCRVKAFKKGIAEPTVATIYFDEFCPATWDNTRLFWARMPRAQIEKCAKARALRTAYPDLGGLYIPEEMDRMSDEHTASGRQIVSGVPMSGSREAAQAVAARKIAEANAERKPLEAEIVEEAPAAPKEYQGNIELDWTEEASPIIRGDIANLLDLMKKHCTMTWGKDEWWHCLPKDAETIRAMCEQLSFRLKEIMPKKVSPGTSPTKEEQGGKGAVQGKAATVSAARTTSAPKTSGKEAATAASTATIPQGAGPLLVSGVIEQATPQAGKSPRLYVLLRMTTSKTAVAMTAWDTAHFPPLIAGKGKQCELLVKRTPSKDGKAIFTNIISLKRVGLVEYDEDGKTPIIQQKTREAGNLFQP